MGNITGALASVRPLPCSQTGVTIEILLPAHQAHAPGGIGVAARGLAAHVPSALPVGDHLTVIGLNGADPRGPAASARPRLGTRGAVARLLYEQTTVAESARSADLVHVCDARPLLFSRAPFIITVHDVTFIDHPEWMPKNVALYKSAMLRAALLRGPRAIVCDSHHTRRRLLSNVPATRYMKVDVIHLGVEAPSDGTWGPEDSEPYFLTVSTIEPRKNHLTLLSAYQRVRQAGYPLRWKVVGSAGHLAEPIVQALKGQEGVDVLGHVTAAERDRLLAGATFFALPSFEEGFGFPVLEAMVRGVPAACSTGSSLDEVAAESAFRVSADDSEAWSVALQTLAEDSQLRQDLSELGRSRATSFTWDATAGRVVRLYDELREPQARRSLVARQRHTGGQPSPYPGHVLYLDDADVLGPRQRALMGLVRSLPPTVIPSVMCPDGELADALNGTGTRATRLPELKKTTAETVGLTAALTAATASVAVRRLAREADVDVIHATSIRTALVASMTRRVLNGPPVVLEREEAHAPSLGGALVRRGLYGLADAVIERADYAAAGRVDFNGGTHREGDPAIDYPSPTASRAAARAALGLGSDVRLAGVVANLSPPNGQDTVIKAMDLIRARAPHARLILQLDPTDRRRGEWDDASFERWLYRLVRGRDLESRIEFWAPREDLSTVMRALDILLIPSWEESSSVRALRAMALGTAVVGTDTGCLSDYITHGVDGFLLSPREDEMWAVALERLLRDDELRERIGRRGIQTARAHGTPQISTSQLLKIYDQVSHRPVGFGARPQGVDRDGDLAKTIGP